MCFMYTLYLVKYPDIRNNLMSGLTFILSRILTIEYKLKGGINMYFNITKSFFSSKPQNEVVGMEARSILKDSNIRMLGKTQVFVGEKSSTEVSLVFSMCKSMDESLQLYKDIKTRKSPLLIAKMRRYYVPRRIVAPIGIKTLRLDNAKNIRYIIAQRQSYSLQSIISNESLIQADSIFYDLSTLTKLIENNTLDKNMKQE